jgi:hypothetical protein
MRREEVEHGRTEGGRAARRIAMSKERIPLSDRQDLDLGIVWEMRNQR